MPTFSLPHRGPPDSATLNRARVSTQTLQDALRASRASLGSDCFAVAWMSDLHLHAHRPYAGNLGFYGDRVDCSANLRLALAELAALDPLPDLLVLGGDLADSGCEGEAPADEYAELRRVLTECLPAGLRTLAIAGNHDHADRDLSADWHRAWHDVLPGTWPVSVHAADYFFSEHVGGWRILGLDSRQGQPLSPHQCAWLAAELKRDPTTPTLVLVHRPFTTVGNWVDDFRLQDRAAFDLLDASPAVRAIWSGHTHLPAAWSYRRKKHIVFPSLAYGIPGPCGWGVGIFARGELAAVWLKPLSSPWLDGVTFELCTSSASLQPLAFSPYTASPLYNPCLLPRE